MLGWMIVLLVLVCLSGVMYYLLSGIKIKNGWQHGQGLVARYLDDRRRRKFNEQLPEALSTMSNALRAGFSISQAFDSVVAHGDSPMSDEFAVLQQQLRIGMSFEDALESMSQRVGSDDLTLVTTAILISRKTGGNVTEIFDKISDTIRGRLRIERKVHALTAQGRMQGVIVSALPLFLGVVMTILKPGMMIPFLTSTVGLIAMLSTCVLIGVGWLMIRRIIRIDV